MKKKTDKRNPETEELDAEGRSEDVEAEGRSEAPAETPQQERDRLQDQLRRAMADLQNIRKRQFKEMEEARRRAVEGLAAELLPVLDNFELALEAHERHESESAEGQRDTAAMVEGVRMVRALLQSVLERHGLAEIPAHGQRFDPNVHEAVGMDPAADVEHGHVSKVMQQGYTVGERVIRPAKVIVAGPSQTGGPADEPGEAAPPDENP